MPLTPADVHNVAFSKPPIGKRGYNEDEVDAFLDLVENELTRLIEENSDLRQRIEELGEVLNDLDESVAVLGKGIERGAPIIEALEDVGGTLTLPAMLETFDEFHAARQALRVALLAIAQREGTTASELARTLGISRQLASRLAVEAEKGS